LEFRRVLFRSIGHLDELRRDSDVVARRANTPFENVPDIEPAADLLKCDILFPEEERGRATGDLQTGDLGQDIDDLLGEAVAEVLILLVRAHVGERQYGDGRERCGMRHGLDAERADQDRKSTRLNSSHVSTSYAVFCL